MMLFRFYLHSFRGIYGAFQSFPPPLSEAVQLLKGRKGRGRGRGGGEDDGGRGW